MLGDEQPDAREGWEGRGGVAERLVVPGKPGNAGRGKGPQFKANAIRSEGPRDWETYQLRKASRNTYGSDADGNLISDGTTTYGYDAENRLISSGAGAALVYDPLVRLWQTSGPSAGVTQFLYDGDALVAEYNASGTVLGRYVHGADAGDDPIVWYEGSGITTAQRRLMLADHQGSIDLVIDGSGNQIGINAYDDYGIPQARQYRQVPIYWAGLDARDRDVLL